MIIYFSILLPTTAWWAIGVFGSLLFAALLSKTILGWMFIGDDENGVVIKKWGFGPDLEEGRIISTNNQAGVQATMLQPGLHFWKWWWMFKVEKTRSLPFQRVLLG